MRERIHTLSTRLPGEYSDTVIYFYRYLLLTQLSLNYYSCFNLGLPLHVLSFRVAIVGSLPTVCSLSRYDVIKIEGND
jgi:hypothetical protein